LGKFALFHNPKVVNGPSQPILLIHKGFLIHVGKSFLHLGQIWDRIQFFLYAFRPVRAKEFTHLPCRIALTLGERVRAIFSLARIAVSEPPLPNRLQ
jgi:hypothetical protein